MLARFGKKLSVSVGGGGLLNKVWRGGGAPARGGGAGAVIIDSLLESFREL